MELQTITKISKSLNLSTRALRYYEQIGLIQSEKKSDYAYRVYSEESIKKIKQIIILRKLRIPLKQIAEILQNSDTEKIINTFQKNLSEIDEELTALSTIRDIINNFISRLNEKMNSDIPLALLDHYDLLEAVDAISLRQIPLKEKKTVEDLQIANEKLNKLDEHDVRIIYLPPMTIASIHIVGHDENGNHAEDASAIILDDFINNANLKSIYPCARIFDFNNPDGIPDEDVTHGYERWVTIPDELEVPAPLRKKYLAGGLYAAHTITMGNFEAWNWLYEWVANNKSFDFRWETVDGVCGWLEEHLNYWDWNNKYEGKIQQLDLLIPISLKND